MKKTETKAVIVLVSICVAVALLLAGINLITKSKIESENESVVKESLEIVMPGGSFNGTPDDLKENAPETVKTVYTEKTGRGHVVMLVTNKGYTGKEIAMTVSIMNDGKIGKMVVTKNEESIVPPGLEALGSYGDAYQGASAGEVPELVTGATVQYTEGAIKDALIDAFKYLGYIEENTEEELYASDAELIAIVKEMTGSNLNDITPENADKTLKRLYVLDNGGHAVYLRTYAQYGGKPETDTVVCFDKDGKIVSVNNLYWKVGHSVEDGAPNASQVEEFFGGYVGKTETEGVELVTGATGTATNFKNALDVGIDAVNASRKIEAFAAALSGSASVKDITPKTDGSPVKRIFFDEALDSYVIYTVTSTKYGPETEGFAVIKDGVITKISLYSWRVGHSVEEGAPTEERLQRFENDFVGLSLDTVDGVELTTGATRTAENFRNAIKEGLEKVDYIANPKKFRNGGILLGSVLLVLMVSAITAAVLFDKGVLRKGGRKNEKQ